METAEARLKRMKIRSWRRGLKEMDLVLGPYADARLPMLDEPMLLLFDRLLNENDQDLMAWIIGTDTPPAWIVPMLTEVTDFAQLRLAAER